MQRGAKIALASAIVLGGVVGASLFRKPPASPDGDRPRAADRFKLQRPSDEAGLAKLSGLIEPLDEPAPPAPSATPKFEAKPLTSASVAPKTMPSTWNQAVESEAKTPPVEHAAASRARFQLHRIRDGDTLSSLARHYLGSSKRFMEIYEANLDRLTSPDLLPIGGELKIPPADAVQEEPDNGDAAHDVTAAPLAAIPPGTIRRSEPAPRSTARTYQVKAGDTLATIAKHFYGDSERYAEIYEANRERLKTPADLCEGVLLTIP